MITFQAKQLGIIFQPKNNQKHPGTHGLHVPFACSRSMRLLERSRWRCSRRGSRELPEEPPLAAVWVSELPSSLGLSVLWIFKIFRCLMVFLFCFLCFWKAANRQPAFGLTNSFNLEKGRLNPWCFTTRPLLAKGGMVPTICIMSRQSTS